MVEMSLKPVLMVFVVLVLGVVFAQVIADNQVANTELSSIFNETVTLTQSLSTNTNETIESFTNRQAKVTDNGITSILFFGNVSNNTNLASVTVGLSVNSTRSGEIIISGDKFPGPGPYNISYTHITEVTGSTGQDDVVQVNFFGNVTIGTQITGINSGDEINITKSTGAISLSPANFSAGTYNTSYNYEGDLYVSDTKSHTFLKLNTLFFILVLLAVAIGGAMMNSKGFTFDFGK